MFNKLFKLADKFERKWNLSKVSQQKLKAQPTNIQKFDAAYIALQNIITELSNSEFNRPEYSKIIQINKNDLNNFFLMVKSKINSGDATEEWILKEGQKLFMDNAAKIYLIAKDINDTYRSLKIINQSVENNIASIIKFYNSIRNNIYSIAPPIVSDF